MSPEYNPEERVPFRDRPIPEIISILQVHLGKEAVAYAIGDNNTKRVERLARDAAAPAEETETRLRDLAAITEIVVVENNEGSQTLWAMMNGKSPHLQDRAPLGLIREGRSAEVVASAPYWGEMGA